MAWRSTRLARISRPAAPRARLAGRERRRSRVPVLRRARLPVPAVVELRGAEQEGVASAIERRAAARGGALGRALRRGDALYWQYDFSYHGGPLAWRSGFAQAVAAQALARAGVLLGDPLLGAAAAASFRGLRRTLLMPLAGGSWIREYGFTREVILNAQLQSIISLESYAAIARSAAARRVARDLVVATRRVLPRFDMGCWSYPHRADLAQHVRRWSRCLP
jgi:hypothetical protein